MLIQLSCLLSLSSREGIGPALIVVAFLVEEPTLCRRRDRRLVGDLQDLHVPERRLEPA
jgi:hypothetical protein